MATPLKPVEEPSLALARDERVQPTELARGHRPKERPFRRYPPTAVLLNPSLAYGAAKDLHGEGSEDRRGLALRFGRDQLHSAPFGLSGFRGVLVLPSCSFSLSASSSLPFSSGSGLVSCPFLEGGRCGGQFHSHCYVSSMRPPVCSRVRQRTQNFRRSRCSCTPATANLSPRAVLDYMGGCSLGQVEMSNPVYWPAHIFFCALQAVILFRIQQHDDDEFLVPCTKERELRVPALVLLLVVLSSNVTVSYLVVLSAY